jgi:Holin family.
MNSIYSIIVALIFNCMDLLTGIIAGIKMRDIQSSKLRDGLFKKVGFLFLLLLRLVGRYTRI